MPFFLDTQETTQRFSKQMEEFCSLLDTNHIRHGSPDDLFEFERVLENSNQFRHDLSALVKSVVRKEHDELLLTDMMSIIAASIGGPSFAETNADISKPTNALMDFLLGTGCWKKFGSPSMGSQSAPPPVARPVHTEEPRPVRLEEPRPVPAQEARPIQTPPSAADENQPVPADASTELRQTLTRLEIHTLQVKLHLDAIEQRLNKIEPTPEGVAAHPASPPEPPLPPVVVDKSHLEPLVRPVVADRSHPEPLLHPIVAESVAQSPAEDIPLFRSEPPTRAIFSHEPAAELDSDDDFSSPTFAYGNEKGRNFALFGVFVVLLIVVVAAILFARTDRGQTLWKAGMSGLQTVITPSGRVPVQPGSAAEAVSSPPAPAPTSKSATSPTAASPPTPVPAAPSRAPNGTGATPSGVKYVSPNVMEGNLLYAPRPIYPSMARAEHLEGKVALQATISKAGSVMSLHTINGPQALRSAAVDAVRKWRYKPYTADGQPMDVQTTVYVDFSLRPPPAIAH